MRKLQLLSISHDNSSSDLRNQLSLSQIDWNCLRDKILTKYNAEGVVILNTCNRIEIVYECAADIRFDILREWTRLADVDYDRTRLQFRTFLGTHIVIRYLLVLSLGLKSAIYGDDQILHQMKRSFEAARSAKSLSTLLERAYQQIMQMHKYICNNTAYRTQTVSLAYHALKSILQHLGTDKSSNARILIIGAGDMAQQVKKYLPKFKYGKVTIANRTRSKAEALAVGTQIEVVDYDSIGTEEVYDVVISCATQGMAMITQLQSLSYGIDLSTDSLVGINFAAEFPIVRLEDIQGIITTQNRQRMSCIPVVKRIVSSYAQIFETWVQGWEGRQMARLSQAA